MAAEGYHPDESVKGQRRARLALRDLACMTKEEAAAHEKKVLLGGAKPEDVYGPDVVALVERRLREGAALECYR